MGRPRVHDAVTRERLVDAAERLLANGGPDAVTVRAVADTVGVSTRAVYSTFGTKEGLLAELRLRGFDLLGERTRATPRTDDPAHDLMVAGVETYRAMALDHSELYQLMFEWPIADAECAEEEQQGRALDALLALRELVERGAAGGLWPADRVDDFTMAAWSGMHGLATLERNGFLGSSDAAVDAWRTQASALVAGFRQLR